MRLDEAYLDRPELAVVRHLQRAGRWDEALALLPRTGSPDVAVLRADVLADRHQWRLDDPAEALAAVAAIRDSHPAVAMLLDAQLEYWAFLFHKNTDGVYDDLPGRVADPVEQFHRVWKDVDDEGLRDWAGFWYAVSTENMRDDHATAAPVYAEVYDGATRRGELLLASYATRHLGGLALFVDGDAARGLELLRLSMYQRATVGARPQLTAAQAMYAMALDDVAAAEPGAAPKPGAGKPGVSPESGLLRDLVAHTAAELDLTWLNELQGAM